MKAYFLVWIFCFSLLVGCGSGGGDLESTMLSAQDRALAQESYVFAYPMLECYRMLQAWGGSMLAKGNSPFNRFFHATTLAGPLTTNIVKPNNDTLYSTAILDLRAEPVIVHVPAVPERYYAIQLIDLYTHNLGYIGTRATGVDGGSFLIAGPEWDGSAVDGTDQTFQSETYFVLCLMRVQVGESQDVTNVTDLQREFAIEPLSAFLGQRPPAQPPLDIFPRYDAETAQTAGFIDYFNFLLGQVDIHPSETALIASFANMGIAPGAPYVPSSRDNSYNAGIDNALQQIRSYGAELGEMVNGWSLPHRVFGNRQTMQGKYLMRASAAMFGLFGSDLEECYYPTAAYSEDGAELNGANERYVLHFDADQMPLVNAFWSLTMYNEQGSMVANSINRYAIGDRTEGLQYGSDGSLTIYIQKDDPGGALTANWLPAPRGAFTVTLRMYLPAPEALAPLYAPPPIQKY